LTPRIDRLLNISSSAVRIADDSKSTKLSAGYPIFDWLRFFLASVVALGHAGLILHSEILGNLAVQVFFSLSGWLIGGILLNSRFKELPRFYFNRATRIWLPYFFAVGALYGLSFLREPVTARWLEFLYYDLTFTHNWFSLRPDAALALSEMPLKGTGNGFWSISVEEQFYLVAPLTIVAVKFGRSPLLWIFISAILWLFQFTDFASISLGVLAATIQGMRGAFHLRRPVIATLAGICVTSLLALSTLSYALGAPAFAISVVLLCARPGSRHSIGRFVGAISYPVYLNHWMGAFIVNGISKRIEWLAEPSTGIFSYALGVIAGALAYLLVDRTVMAERDRLYSSLAGKILAAVAYALVALGILGGLAAATNL
jgi:peptidoglycan/LPS O-acetylase OafA/YrhL